MHDGRTSSILHDVRWEENELTSAMMQHEQAEGSRFLTGMAESFLVRLQETIRLETKTQLRVRSTKGGAVVLNSYENLFNNSQIYMCGRVAKVTGGCLLYVLLSNLIDRSVHTPNKMTASKFHHPALYWTF